MIVAPINESNSIQIQFHPKKTTVHVQPIAKERTQSIFAKYCECLSSLVGRRSSQQIVPMNEPNLRTKKAKILGYNPAPGNQVKVRKHFGENLHIEQENSRDSNEIINELFEIMREQKNTK